MKFQPSHRLRLHGSDVGNKPSCSQLGVVCTLQRVYATCLFHWQPMVNILHRHSNFEVVATATKNSIMYDDKWYKHKLGDVLIVR